MNETLDYAGQTVPYTGNGGVGLPPVQAWSSGSIASSEIDPSPNQVRRSKRQPMAELSSAISTPSPVPLSLNGIASRGLEPGNPIQQQQQQPKQRSLSVSLANSPSHLSRSPRMGRKSLRTYQQAQEQQPQPQPQPAPPLYENQSYPPLENLSLNESTRSRSGSEPSIYAPSRSERAQGSAVRFTCSHSPPRLILICFLSAAWSINPGGAAQ